MKKSDLNRRDFVKWGTLSGLAAGTSGAPAALLAQSGAADLPQVPRKPLGKTGFDVPILGMGGSQKFDPRYDKRLHRAFAMGINYFDTSETYSNGQSQKTLGTFVEQVGDRKKIWLTSKVNDRTHPAGQNAPPEHYEKNLGKILELMRTDYLDSFFMHGVGDERFLEPEFIRMSEGLKKAGKIRLFGFSCHDGNVPELLTKAARVGGIDLIMFRYSFRTYGDAKLNRAIDAAKEAGIGLLAMKTMAAIPEDDERIIDFQNRDFTLPQAKLKAIWADDRIDCCVSEMGNIQMVQENSEAALSEKELTARDFMELNRLSARTASLHCLGCRQHCESRIDGELNVADTLRYLMYADSYGDLEKGREGYNRLSDAEKKLDSVSLAKATAACPQGIDIARRLERARRKLRA